MGLRDKLRDLTTQAEKAAAEHKDEIRKTVDKVETAADQRTGGKYHDKIKQAGAKVDAYLDRLEPEKREVQEQGPDEPQTRPATERPDEPAA
jgi:hypothetical protein